MKESMGNARETDANDLLKVCLARFGVIPVTDVQVIIQLARERWQIGVICVIWVQFNGEELKRI